MTNLDLLLIIFLDKSFHYTPSKAYIYSNAIFFKPIINLKRAYEKFYP